MNACTTHWQQAHRRTLHHARYAALCLKQNRSSLTKLHMAHSVVPCVQGIVVGCVLMFLLQRQRPPAAKNGAPGEKTASPSSSQPSDGTTMMHDHDLPSLSDEEKDALAATAQALATRGKGILAADESTPTVRRRWDVKCVRAST